jgi:thiamine-phosphate pyrophosphorylase
MLVTDRRRTRGRELAPLVEEAVGGGVGIVQVREPDLRDDELGELIERIRRAIGTAALLVANGRPRVAAALGTGLHLPAAAPRPATLDPRVRPVGRSVHDEVELRAALAERVDYLVVGTVFESEGKPGRKPAGLALVERVCRQVAPLPVYGIGGITVSRVPPLLHSGAHGVAVCAAILAASDPRRVAEAMSLALAVAERASQVSGTPRSAR